MPICRQVTGRRLSPLSARFTHHRGRDLQPIERALGCEVEFDAGEDELCFSADVADLPLTGHDPYLQRLMETDLEMALAGRTSQSAPLCAVVENILVQLLPDDQALLAVVAKLLAQSERTLARRLAAEGESFGEILDDLRRDLALRYLADKDLQISQIAWRLGFNHPSALSHACRRWFGRSSCRASAESKRWQYSLRSRYLCHLTCL